MACKFKEKYEGFRFFVNLFNQPGVVHWFNSSLDTAASHFKEISLTEALNRINTPELSNPTREPTWEHGKSQ